MKKTPIALALAAMAGVGGTLVSTNAYAVNVAERDIGDALIFPYYTARDGWNSLFNITNASANTVALKVRFRESYNSRDVLDFNLVMSPYDVWTGRVVDTPEGPRLYSKDSSCTSPLMMEGDAVNGDYFPFVTNGYTGNAADGGPTGIDRAREGHMEVLMMGAAEAGAENETDGGPLFPTVYYANHDTLNCATVDAQFLANTADNRSFCPFEDADDSDGNPAAECDFWRNVNSLKGNFSLIDSTSGIGAGGEATTLANYRTGWNLNIVKPILDAGDDIPVPPFDGGSEDVFEAYSATLTNDVTAQQYPYFLEPTLDSADAIAPLTVDNPPLFLGIPEVATNLLGFALGELVELHIEDQDCGDGQGDNIFWGDSYTYLGLGNLRFGRGVDAVSFALRQASLINEWSTNVNTGAATDWAVTYPTKGFYVDVGTNENAAINPMRYGCSGTDGSGNWTDCDFDRDGNVDHPLYNPSQPLPWVFDVTGTVAFAQCDDGGPLSTVAIHPAIHMELFSEVFDGQSCDEVTYNLWDREEGGARSGGTSISPAPPQPTDSLCYETNVLAFGEGDSTYSALGSSLAQGVDVSVLSSNAKSGWMNLGQVDSIDDWVQQAARAADEAHNCEEDCGPVILPPAFSAAVGFAFKERDFGDPTLSFGQLMDHSAPKPLEQYIMDGGLEELIWGDRPR